MHEYELVSRFLRARRRFLRARRSCQLSAD